MSVIYYKIWRELWHYNQKPIQLLFIFLGHNDGWQKNSVMDKS